MRILHVSHNGLPDVRVERMAKTMAKEGHEVLFVGGQPSTKQNLSVFQDVGTVRMASGPRIAYDPTVKRRWLKAISDRKPDVVHAHNIEVAHYLIGSEWPTIFDDHEHMSSQSFKLKNRSLMRRTASGVLYSKFAQWETELAQQSPVLTVSEEIADVYRPLGRYVGVVFNTPYLYEVEFLENPERRSGLVYVGNDFRLPKFVESRDMTGLTDILTFDVISGLPFEQMLEKLTHYEIGLLPYHPHPFQRLANPNKCYEYLHAGLQIVLQENYARLFRGVRFVHSFKDYSDIRNVVDSVPKVDHMSIVKMARSEYVWDRREQVIKDAYKAA